LPGENVYLKVIRQKQKAEAQNCYGCFPACNRKKKKQPNFDGISCPHRPEHNIMTDRLLTPATFGDKSLHSGPSRTSIKLTLTKCFLVNRCSLIDEEKTAGNSTKHSFKVRKATLYF